MRKVKIISICIFFIIVSMNIASACTGFTASDDNKVLVGSNEDNTPAKRYVGIYPPGEGKYGKILFGYGYQKDSMQQGMNDQGLFWDGFACPYLEVTKGEGLTPIPDPEYLFYNLITETCSTIYDVIDILDSHDIRDLPIEICQVLFVDRLGNSVIFEGDDYVFKEGNYQVVTNFYQTHPELGVYPCWRYDTAVNMLENMNDLTMEYFRDICDATHQEWPLPYPRTIYSLVCDLTNNKIHYYYEYRYNKLWEINLSEMFEFGEYTYDVLNVFNNHEPSKPNKPIGPNTGSVNKEYEFSCTALDIDGDQLFYKWDWGDGNISGWLGPYDSGELCYASFSWSEKGEYSIRVKARDTNCGISEWSNPQNINITRKKVIQKLFPKFQENYPILFQFLRRVPYILFLIGGNKI
jgi:hypothetical protein